MAGGPNGLSVPTGTAAARLLTRARLRHFRPSPLDVLAYATGAGIAGLLLWSAAASTAALETSPASVTSVRLAVVVAGAGVVMALIAAVASGARGGPLALATPMVLLVMLAPVDRGGVLRMPAVRQVVVAGALGAIVAGGLWIILASAAPRGSPVLWLAAGGLGGSACAGVALLGAGLRMSDRTSVVVRLVIVVWWLVDATLEMATSPMAVLARMPFTSPSAGGIAYVVAIVVGVAVLGVHRIGGLSLEKAWRRSGAADQLRVAVGLNDLRTALLLLRRRALESPRRRPWRTVGGRWTARYPIAARSVRSLLRWPLSRLGRFMLLAATSGAIAVASADVPFLSLGVALLTYWAALDAVDALSQELDHPDLQQGYPLAGEVLARRHLGVPLMTMTVFCAIASCAAGAVGGVEAAVTGLLATPIIALAAVAGATLTATRIARPLTKITDVALPPEAVAPRIIVRVAAPIIPLLASLVPVIAAHGSGPSARILAAVPGGVVSLAVLGVLLYRPQLDFLASRIFVSRP